MHSLPSERNNHCNICYYLICNSGTITIILFGQITRLQYHIDYIFKSCFIHFCLYSYNILSNMLWFYLSLAELGLVLNAPVHGGWSLAQCKHPHSHIQSEQTSLLDLWLTLTTSSPGIFLSPMTTEKLNHWGEWKSNLGSWSL